jgi:EAL domain-containing protein (putative c-di-GMP-specific phosphodiesterase class I)
MDDDRFVLVAQYIRPAERNSEHTSADYIELLLRMVGGNQSLLPAAQFVPAAEHFGLMSMLDRWVISKSFAWLNDHRHQLDNLGHCFINLSTQSLGDDEFADFLESQVGTLQLPVTKVCFEITEGASIRDMEAATDFVDRFKKLGCKFALDDFGHGFSSFSYLQILPIDIVKIDKSYVINALTDPASAAIVRAINDLSHGLGKISVAEGVESDLHRDFLYNLGVDYVQGHAIHSPEHLDDLVEQFGGDRVLGIPAAIQYGPLVNQH